MAEHKEIEEIVDDQVCVICKLFTLVLIDFVQISSLSLSLNLGDVFYATIKQRCFR